MKQVRVDAGPSLNGELIRRRLVDELSVLIAPHLLGDGSQKTMRLFSGHTGDDRPLVLIAVQPLRANHVWLRYRLPA